MVAVWNLCNSAGTDTKNKITIIESIKTEKDEIKSGYWYHQSLTGRAQAVLAKHKHKMATFIFVLEDNIHWYSKTETSHTG